MSKWDFRNYWQNRPKLTNQLNPPFENQCKFKIRIHFPPMAKIELPNQLNPPFENLCKFKIRIHFLPMAKIKLPNQLIENVENKWRKREFSQFLAKQAFPEGRKF